jgi:hypothetical protein
MSWSVPANAYGQALTASRPHHGMRLGDGGLLGSGRHQVGVPTRMTYGRVPDLGSPSG